MIDQSKLNTDWLSNTASKQNKADRNLIEKTTRALLLLEGLVKVGIPFIFKGGTALLLRFSDLKRLSIDIDIIISDAVPNLETKLDRVAKLQGFTRVQIHQRRTKSAIKKQHFKFFYTAISNTGRADDNILLDVLLEQVEYQRLDNIPIQMDFIPQLNSPLTALIPSIEDLLGDKLTAFPPNTTGIPYEKNGRSKALEIIKQLYDIGNLFDHAEDLQRIRYTFLKFAKTELGYRQLDLTADDVLQDIFNTALTISTRGKVGGEDFTALQKGITAIKPFILDKRYHLDYAIIDAAKAAYLSQLIRTQQIDIQRFIDPSLLKDTLLEQPFYTQLNKLKKSNVEAFFYWVKTAELFQN